MSKVAPSDQALEQRHSHGSGSGKRDSHGGAGRGSIVHAAVDEWRYFMHWSGWYDSTVAVTLRRTFRGKAFTVVTMIALFIALFFADLCMVAQVPTNTLMDVVLTIVFSIFLAEFLSLALTDASYLFSFFFWMDLLGTVSLVFDIPFMLGVSATESEKYSGQRGYENLIASRAARVTKLGARAGRLSRVMKLLRYLPFISNSTQDDDVKMAKVISNQLTNVLSTRVAFLTICIVVVLPIFGMFTYPEVDDSMSAWTQLLSQNVEELYTAVSAVPQDVTAVADLQERIHIELDRFASFYSELSYGPFQVCFGRKTDDEGGFQCEPTLLPLAFDTSFSEPSRKGSIRDISEMRFQTSFDLATPKQMEALANVGLICFIIIVMTVFGLVTSSSISVIALQPLERMLSVVRQRCKQIFKYTDDLQEESDEENEEEDYDDTEQSSEFVLLEKVVAKLAAIAHLSATKDEPEMKEGMTENEVMVLNWMQGTQVSQNTPQRSRSMKSCATRNSHGHGQLLAVTQDLCDQTVADSATTPAGAVITSTLNAIPSETIAALESDQFNTLELPKDMKIAVAHYIVTSFEGSSSWVRSFVPDLQLNKFVTVCEGRYLPNPFHNFSHAVDVEYAVFRAMRLVEAGNFLPESSMFWLILASVAHDLGHLGVNNQYLIETSHELALKYNDRSPLENMHCATMFQVTNEPESNVFAQVKEISIRRCAKALSMQSSTQMLPSTMT
jgi:hypothetical protein